MIIRKQEPVKFKKQEPEITAKPRLKYDSKYSFTDYSDIEKY